MSTFRKGGAKSTFSTFRKGGAKHEPKQCSIFIDKKSIKI
jgi:hypothetical protein